MEHREIGGYLELERFSGSPYHEKALALNCGRACLSFLIRLRSIKHIWLPDFLCDSVSAVCLQNGVEIHRFKVGEDFAPIYDFEITDGGYLYLVDYYGQLTADSISFARSFASGQLIIDEAHGFYRKPWEGVDTLYTCRKFFGVADGAYLYTRELYGDGYLDELIEMYNGLAFSESHKNMDYLLGRLEESAQKYFKAAQENNARFADEPCMKLSLITENLLRGIDYEFVRKKRENNYAILSDLFDKRNLLSPVSYEGPFMYPLLAENTDRVRETLASKGIYIPTLWPNVLEACAADSVAYNYAKNILPLPVDQRYSDEDMNLLAEEVLRCLR